MSDKVYKPEVIQDTPFPGQEIQSATQSSGTQQVSTPTTTKSGMFPVKKVATELLSTALNTRSKKILQEFELQQSGGLKIGDYKEGTSGDLRITPNGITARDNAGITTFAIDGTTGDATFRGIVQAADFTVVDEKGLVSLNSFDSDSVEVFLKTITSGTYVDVSGASLDFNLNRETNVLILVNINCYIGNMVDTDDAQGLLVVNVDGSNFGNIVLSYNDVLMYTPNFSSTESRRVTLGGNQLKSLSSGDHTIKIQAKILGPNSERLEITTLHLTYVTLGR